MSSELLSVIREEFGRVAYTFKTHQKIIDRYNNQIKWQRRTNAFLLTVTAGGTIDILIRDQYVSKIVTLLFSAMALFLAIYQLSMNTDRIVDQHRVTARSLWLVREEYIHLISDLKSQAISADLALKRRDELTLRTAYIYNSAPDTDSKAYMEAQKALKHNEELTFSLNEIDLLLPERLRETSINQNP